VDPLRPFTDLIRSLSRTAAPRRAEASGTQAQATPACADQAESAATPGAPSSLHERLRAQSAQLAAASPRRMRELFVETVLALELGEGLARDPAFAEVVGRVAEQLGDDPRIATRLEQVLLEMTAR